ncbi:MAG: hypothetical protein J4N86_07960 [Chloroflexi bacterium]|nr:hypothetical protein [Chloroflexota bacterium]MCI0811781.1 hypothetical protein [Chloroflexota bacterium]MCI0848453.1 hypothetical protein [Chloroflexota bacterium]MCI0897337.1 hypothetical protein [Chloroflexota bacterium]MCI0900482.1 hypothetical protein [Chloroflexota bacterium]
MTTQTNIQGNNSNGNEMKRSMFLAPRFSGKAITMMVFGYLAMVTMILIMTANPFQSTASLDFGPQSAEASVQTVVVEIPSVQVPAAPYIIIEPAN